jgi:hypothetical protein
MTRLKICPPAKITGTRTQPTYGIMPDTSCGYLVYHDTDDGAGKPQSQEPRVRKGIGEVRHYTVQAVDSRERLEEYVLLASWTRRT